MISALVLLLSGLVLATTAQYEGEMSDTEFKLTSTGIVLLAFSAFIQALETIIENRLFLIDPSMSAFYLQSAVASWKMVFAVALMPFCHMIPMPESYVSGGKFESLGMALTDLFNDSTLVFLFILMMVSNGLHALAGMAIIKEESAM